MALLALAACQPNDEIRTEPEQAISTAPVPDSRELAPRPTTTIEQATTTTTDVSAPDRVGLAGWVGDVDLLSSGHNTSDDFATVRRDIPFNTAVTAGYRLTVTFPGGVPGTEDSLCNIDHRIEVDERDGQVNVRVIQFQILAPDAAMRDCAAAGEQSWALTTRLQEPLGNRELIDTYANVPVTASAEEARLVPTWLPEGWVTLRDDELLPLRTVRFVAPTGDVLILQTAPLSTGYRIKKHRREHGWEPTSVRNQDDGVFLSLEDRRTSVSFEEQGWYYKINSTPGVDPSIVLNFARSFERPALVEGELDPRLTPREVLDPQPGQEEREARALQGQLDG